MEKDQKLLGKLTAGTEINSSEPFGHVLQGRRAKPGSSQDSAQWINVATIGNPSEQRGFERGRAAAHERVVNDVARLEKPAANFRVGWPNSRKEINSAISGGRAG